MGHTDDMTNTTLPRIPVWTVCDRMVKARKDAAMSQTDMAERLSISRRSISRYEDGIIAPSTAVLVAWAYFTNVPTDWLLDGTTDGDEGGSTHSTWTPLIPGQQSFQFLLVA